MRFFSYHGGHSKYGDGEGMPEDFVKKAIELKFAAFGFSEHLPCDKKKVQPEGAVIRGLETFPEYVETIKNLQQKYEGQIDVLCGMEVDYIPEQVDYILESIERFQFDYVVGSVHFLDGLVIDYSPEIFGEAIEKFGSVEGVYLKYYDTIQQMVEMDCFDIVGHLDLPKKHGYQCESEAVLLKLRETLEIIKSHDCLLDINTAGYAKECRELYPSVEVLKIARDVGVDVTLGDDSHSVDQIGRFFDRAPDDLRAAGYEGIIRLNKKDGRVLRERVAI